LERTPSDKVEEWIAKLNMPLPGIGEDDDDDFSTGTTVITEDSISF
jgi:hypothetical protein